VKDLKKKCGEEKSASRTLLKKGVRRGSFFLREAGERTTVSTKRERRNRDAANHHPITSQSPRKCEGGII